MSNTGPKKAPSPAQKRARALFAKRAKAGDFAKVRKAPVKRAKVNPVLPLAFKTPSHNTRIVAKYRVYFQALEIARGSHEPEWIFDAAFTRSTAAKKYAQELADSLKTQVQIELRD